MKARFEIARNLFKKAGIKRRGNATTARDVGRPNAESSPTSVVLYTLKKAWYNLQRQQY